MTMAKARALYVGTDNQQAARCMGLLQGVGVTLRRAASEQEVLSTCHGHGPTVVLMDLLSDPDSGLRLVQRLAAAGGLVVAIGEEAAALAAIREGAWDYVVGGEREQTRDLPLKVKRALEFCRLQNEHRTTRQMIAHLLLRHERADSHVLSKELVSAIGHELKNPLSALLGYSQVLVEEERGEVGEIAERLVVNVQRLLDMVDNLLDMLRAQAGGLPLTRVATDFNRLVGMSVSEVTNMCEGRQIEFRPATLLPTISLDWNRLLRLTKALLESLLATTEPGELLSVITALEGSEVTLRIVGGEGTQTGCAGPEAQEHRLGGNGAVAVATARAIVRAHGGEVQLEDGSGGCVSVVVRLPIDDNQPFASREREHSLHGSG
jgi:signal transduction histidine kinase